jgi:uncharacterized protein YndB with AHSA1/START domain
MTDLGTSASVEIGAPAARVWEALTTPALIKEWFFGVDTEADWRPGGAIVHRGSYQGRPYEDKGEILEIEPPTRLVHTHWSEVSGTSDHPEHYQRVAWALAERDGVTDLTVTETNLPSAEAKATSDESWPMVLANLKRLLDEGADG